MERPVTTRERPDTRAADRAADVGAADVGADAPTAPAPSGNRKRRGPRGSTKPRRVTMSDVAREAGCSQSTVSFVLNSTSGIQISAPTRERVLRAASQLGYKSPLGSTAGDTPLSGRIGYVVDRLATSPEAVVSIEGARAEAWRHGQNLLVAQTLGDPRIEPDTIDAFVQLGVDAIVYAAVHTREVEVPPALARAPVPVYLLNCHAADRSVPAVVPSEIAGGHRATQHMVALGHTRIATITGEMWMEAANARLAGYRRALASADLPFDPALVVEGDWSASAGHSATARLLALPDPPTAIVCQNDRMAIGCYEALKEAGYRIPDDMSVVGYDDEEIARHLSPMLTTLVLPHREMGQWVIEQLHGGRGASAPYPLVKLECPLVDRHSTAPPRPSR